MCCVYIMYILYAGAFYFTLGNISPKYRSRLSSIQLLALVKSDHINTYGMNNILRPIIEDIKKLVSILIPKFTLIFVP